MKKYGGLVLNAEEQFVFIEDIAIIVEKNDSICPILPMKMIFKSNRRKSTFPCIKLQNFDGCWVVPKLYLLKP